jgi:hypothetical protein
MKVWHGFPRSSFVWLAILSTVKQFFMAVNGRTRWGFFCGSAFLCTEIGHILHHTALGDIRALDRATS